MSRSVLPASSPTSSSTLGNALAAVLFAALATACSADSTADAEAQGAVNVSATPAQSADYSALRERLVQALSVEGGPQVVLSAVQAAPVPGLVEVQLENGPLLYATPSGDFFILGDMYALEGDSIVNLAEQKREAERLELLAGVDAADMIVFSPAGEVRDHITVFTDTTCGYCRKLHNEVADLNNRGIEVRYLAYPRSGLTSKGAQQLATAWCSDTPQETLTKFKNGVELPINACASAPIEAQYQLGLAMGVRGTPAIVTSTGKMVPGYRPAADIERMLGLN